MDGCDCWDDINEQLAGSNAALDLRNGITFKTGKTYPAMLVPLVKLKKSRQPLPVVMMKFCPFCGTDLEAKDAACPKSD